MDSLDTWPRPLPSGERGFDVRALQQLRAGAGAAGGPAGRAVPGEGPGAFLLLVVPPAAVLAGVLLWRQWSRTGSPVFPVLIAAVLVGVALWWVPRLRRGLAAARGRLGSRLADVVDHGVGVVRELTLEPVTADPDRDAPDPRTGEGGRVRARLVLSVNPVRGSRFRATVEAVYDAGAAARLAVGSHGPVRFLREDPEGTTLVDTRLSAAQVEQVYRAAALN